jgi:flagellar M-ring protein FliF
VFLPRSAEDVKALETVVKRAVGFNEQRGDSVVVQAAQFSRIEEPPLPVEPKWIAVSQRYWPVAAGVAALLGIATLVLVYRKGAKKAARRNAALSGIPSSAALAGVVGGASALGEGVRVPELSAPATPSFEEVRDHALALAAKDPATAAVVLRQWLGLSPAQVNALPR